MTGAVFLTSLIIGAAPGGRAHLTAEQVVARMQRVYDKVRDLSASFKQTYTRKAFPKQHHGSGKVYFKKPGMMRWDYDPPEPRQFICDGENAYEYLAEERQVTVLENFRRFQLPAAISFLWGEGRLLEEFTAAFEKEGTPDGFVLALTPIRSEGHLEKLVLVVDAKSFIVKEVTIHEMAGVNHFAFSAVKLNQGLAPTFFHFTPPEGVAVVKPPSRR